MSIPRFLRAAFATTVLVCTLLAIGQSAPPAVEMSGYLGHLTTDKPIYRAGETIYLRCVVLGAVDHAPLVNNQMAYVNLQIKGPKGEVLGTYATNIQDSVAALQWRVPPEAPGGQYTAEVDFPWSGFPPTERKFSGRAYRTPRLNGEIQFLREGYGPGEKVSASLHVERAEGGLPVGAHVAAHAVIDDATAFDGQTVVDALGNCTVEFNLPQTIEHGDGTLSMTVSDGGVVEPIAKTIPILLNTVNVAMYPEGGDLVAGLPCRVYVEGRTPAQKPADLVGIVVDSHGNKIADLRTIHEGRGRFEFTPTAGESYSLKLSQPAGIDRQFPLPAIKLRGVSLRADLDATESLDPVRLRLSATNAGTYEIDLSKRQVEIASTLVKLDAGQTMPIVLTPPQWADGVLVATVKTEDGTPLAERLIFRKSAHTLHVDVKADQSSYVPGQPVSLTITTTDDHGKPIPAVVGLTATDQSVLKMIEKRDRAPRLSEMVLLEDDVRELADAQVYLDPANSQAAMDTDLLLGTQGWRRFATVDKQKFLADYGDAARRVLADVQQPLVRIVNGAGGFGGGGFDGEFDRFGARRLVTEGTALPESQLDAQKDANQAKSLVADDSVLLPMENAEVPSLAAARPAMPVVREYAHENLPNRKPDDRQDFTETVYWAAAIKTNDSGSAAVSFKLSDSVTSFDVTADAFDSTGTLGEGKTTITSVRPFYIEPKIPLEVTTGDVIHLPIALINGTDQTLDQVTLRITADAGIRIGQGTYRVDDSDTGQHTSADPLTHTAVLAPFQIPPHTRVRQIVDLTVGSNCGIGDLIVQAQAGTYSDKVTRKLSVKPVGFPTQISQSGLLESNASADHDVLIPDSLVPGSLSTNIALYPTPLGNLTQALEALMQQPNGCFEQTTSTNYPLCMAQKYFMTHSGVDPAIIEQSAALLDAGYKRLIGFECKNKGYEWFGEDPGHECLTAYGLLEFTDMSSVHPVDAVMLQDTRDWLLARRDGQGGFTHERRSLHTWITDPGCANGYCTWALLECGQTGLDKEVSWLADRAEEDGNSYVKALAANALFLAGDHDGAIKFMDQLAQRQDKDGHVTGATTSVVGSEGQSLDIETTSLAALAWLRVPQFAANAQQAIHYLADSCQNGRYGSTQSTVLALRAIIAYDTARAHPTAPGKAQLFVDDQSAGDALAFDSTTTGALKLPDISSRLTPGQHRLELRMTDGSELPYAISINFNSVTPASSDQCKLSITTSLKDATVPEGQATEARVTVTNRTDETVPTPIAIIGLPGGLEPRYDQLKELVKADRIAAYEVRGREVILYWRDMQPGQTIDLPISLTAAVPGHYTAPASRAYLYYSDEFKQWQPGMAVTITPSVQ